MGATPLQPSVLDRGLLAQRLTLNLLAVVSACYLPWNRAKASQLWALLSRRRRSWGYEVLAKKIMGQGRSVEDPVLDRVLFWASSVLFVGSSPVLPLQPRGLV